MRKVLIGLLVLAFVSTAALVSAENNYSVSAAKNGTIPTNAVESLLVPYANVNMTKVTITTFATNYPTTVLVRWVGMKNNPGNLPDLSRTLELGRGVHVFHDFFRDVVDYDGFFQAQDKFRGQGFLLVDVMSGDLPILMDVHFQQTSGLVTEIPVLNRDDLFRSREEAFASFSGVYPVGCWAMNVSNFTTAEITWTDRDAEFQVLGPEQTLTLPPMSVKAVYLGSDAVVAEIVATAVEPTWDDEQPFVYFFVMEHKYTSDLRVVPTFRLFPMLEPPVEMSK